MSFPDEVETNTVNNIQSNTTNNNNNISTINISTNSIPEEGTKLIDDRKWCLYGNNYDEKYPKYLGKCRAFLYVDNKPLILIGPECKLNEI